LRATLSTRAELLHHRLVGHKLDAVDATNVDDGTELDLADLHGDTTILAWFDAKQCADCQAFIRRLSDRVQDPHRGSNARVLALAPGSVGELANYHLNVGVPLVAVDARAFETLTTKEWDRVFIMVLDRRGHVCFVTPISPQDDSVDAAMDEVLAASDQAEHARARR
jgi:peroxiredoxin